MDYSTLHNHMQGPTQFPPCVDHYNDDVDTVLHNNYFTPHIYVFSIIYVNQVPVSQHSLYEHIDPLSPY